MRLKSTKAALAGALTAAAAVAAVAGPVGASVAHPGGHHENGSDQRGAGRDGVWQGNGQGNDNSQGGDSSHGNGWYGNRGRSTTKHVLLLSVDGLHESDLKWFVRHYPESTLARLTRGGASYTGASTSIPSDSDPGMTAQMTGGSPKTTGVFYDVEYNHAVDEAGTTSCNGTPTGGDVVYDSPDDIDDTRLDAGQGLTGLPDSILQMTSTPQDLLNPATFPVDPTTCQPISPSSYLKVNTIFNVAHDAGLLTAWSDKHPVYTSFNGPEGNGITDSFDPEIDSTALHHDGSPWLVNGKEIAWTGDNAATMQYDDYKVQAVLNWINGENHQGTTQVGTPAIFGMNFQTVSTAEKLPTSDGLMGGYYPGTTTPGPLLQRALRYVNNRIGLMVRGLAERGLLDQTAIVLSAKHGQSPQDPNQLKRVDDGPIIDAVNAAWAQTPDGKTDPNTPLIAAGTDDDAVMWWFSNEWKNNPKYYADASQFVRDWFNSPSSTQPGNDVNGNPITVQNGGIATGPNGQLELYTGPDAAQYFGVPASDPNHPDVWGVVQTGVVYTGGKKKIAEHGGANPADTNVPIVVYAPHAVHHEVDSAPVLTTQIAPTILQLLGLDPNALQAVQIEHTQVLPGIGGR